MKLRNNLYSLFNSFSAFGLCVLFALVHLNCSVQPVNKEGCTSNGDCLPPLSCVAGKCAGQGNEKVSVEKSPVEKPTAEKVAVEKVEESPAKENDTEKNPVEPATEQGATEKAAPDESVVADLSEPKIESPARDAAPEKIVEPDPGDPGECKDDETRSCYTGDPNTRDKGTCKSGTQTCVNGAWAIACVGETTPAKEICDGKDNDCDGEVDEKDAGCVCATGDTQACGTSDVGTCKKGKQTCSGGQWGSCVGSIEPSKEVCDGKDNNCDGKVDEGLGSLTCGTGECKVTIDACHAGAPQTCTPKSPSKEICDGKDNDCDGKVDGFSESCYGGPSGTSGKGNCKSGTRSCSAGRWSSCVGEVRPTTEVCDGQDNDCDGLYDEGLSAQRRYLDADKDGYGDGAVSYIGCLKGTTAYCTVGTSRAGQCFTHKAGYITRSGDCCDKDPLAKPGQTSYYSVANKCGSFDYNCNNSVERRYPTCSCVSSLVGRITAGSSTSTVRTASCPMPRIVTATILNKSVRFTLAANFFAFNSGGCACYMTASCGASAPVFGAQASPPRASTLVDLGIVKVPATLTYPTGPSYCPVLTTTQKVLCR